ncbi:hypothetical protein LV779_23625 [Streptomyces thinghirensis]|nr:hypothetical protein [Streptomyces thinghirensis]
MNLFKRAWWRLTGAPGKTLMLGGLFFVICTLVLSGFLIQSAAARAADNAKKSVGAVATMQLDVNGLMASGKNDGREPSGQQGGTIGSAGDLKRDLVDRICASSVVADCNYTADGAAFPTVDRTPPARSAAGRPGHHRHRPVQGRWCPQARRGERLPQRRFRGDRRQGRRPRHPRRTRSSSRSGLPRPTA